MSVARGIAMLTKGVRDRDFELRRQGLQGVVDGMGAIGGAAPGAKREDFPAEANLTFLLAFALETDVGLKRAMGAVILATGLLSGLEQIPGYERLLGRLLSSKQPWDFQDSDYQEMSNGIRRMTGMMDVARNFFGDDITAKIAAEKGSGGGQAAERSGGGQATAPSRGGGLLSRLGRLMGLGK